MITSDAAILRACQRSNDIGCITRMIDGDRLALIVGPRYAAWIDRSNDDEHLGDWPTMKLSEARRLAGGA